MQVKVKNLSGNELPIYSTDGSSGVDLIASLTKKIILKPTQRVLVPTGLYVEIPKGFEIQVRPRSGLALKKGITVLNTPGTIDSDYRGEIGVILINHSLDDFIINNGDRIAQAVLNKIEKIEWINSDSLENSERGKGGFGHTGVK